MIQVFKLKNQKAKFDINYLYLLIIFLFTRVIYSMLGVSFDTTTLTYFWQFLDPELLKNRLMESLFYLHAQPPLFNFFLGIILKLGIADYGFWLAYLFMGVICSFVLYALQKSIGIPGYLSITLTILFISSPSTILYENWLYDTYPSATLLLLAAFLFVTYIKTKKIFYFFSFLTILSILVLLRSTFHLLWFIIWVVIVILNNKNEWKRILITAILPTIFATSIFIKNQIVFNEFSSSSWLGMNFWSLSGDNLSETELKNFYEENYISHIALVKRFSELSHYPTELTENNKFKDIPSLVSEVKSTGEPNFNNISYIKISKQYLKDAISIVKRHPEVLLKGFLSSNFAYLRSTSDNYFLEPNRSNIEPIVLFYDYTFYGKLHIDVNKIKFLPFKDKTEGTDKIFYLWLILGIPFLVFYSVYKILNKEIDYATKTLFIFLCLNVMYVAMISNLVEVGENNRMRFMTDPLLIPVLGKFLIEVKTYFINKKGKIKL